MSLPPMLTRATDSIRQLVFMVASPSESLLSRGWEPDGTSHP
ncbi:hypothetical protein [Trichocoleus desertorum]